MPILCLAGKHAASPSRHRNQGVCFSNCRRCGRDMIRPGARWKTVPRGFRVVWRPASRIKPAGGRAPVRNLPMIVAIPAERGRSGVAAGGRPRTGLSALLSAGLKMLVWYGADRLRQWRKDHAARRFEQQGVFALETRHVS